jgi:NADPH-dependent 2,4-dienoyl-CoA reductase/sulfur reductase-like enzyme
MQSELQSMENNVNGTTSADFVTDVVVVGTGPAGGALASFLGSYGT